MKKPLTIDGMDCDEFIRRNADPVWLHQNEMWECVADEDESYQTDMIYPEITGFE